MTPTHLSMSHEGKETLQKIAAISVGKWGVRLNASETSAVLAYVAGVEKERDGLREALEPFAEAAEKADATAARMGFAPSFDEYATEWRFTFGQLRAARAALREGNGGER